MPETEVIKLTKRSPEDRLTLAFTHVLAALQDNYGLDISDPNFRETPQRMARAYAEIFSGLRDTDQQLEKILATSFPCSSEDMIVMKDIEVFSVCPHHLLPLRARVHLAYIPRGKVVGLSKLARMAVLLAKRPVLQETFTTDIVTSLMKIENCQGSACVVEGTHYCMLMRGVRSSAITITSSVRGLFESDDSTRSEFFSLVRSKS